MHESEFYANADRYVLMHRHIQQSSSNSHKAYTFFHFTTVKGKIKQKEAHKGNKSDEENRDTSCLRNSNRKACTSAINVFNFPSNIVASPVCTNFSDRVEEFYHKKL